ncbi:hypothetical protein GCM10008933_08240 [Paenibacillus motobuensis]|uniref:Uncharacterized protein n=1 Tax=Paenibacillus motobuensis TaxID=295324 RepID=A0ABP3HUF3_9BACL
MLYFRESLCAGSKSPVFSTEAYASDVRFFKTLQGMKLGFTSGSKADYLYNIKKACLLLEAAASSHRPP